MKFTLIILFFFVYSFSLSAQITDTAYSIVSIDSKYKPTSSTKHNYRYRAIFSQDYHNEVSGSLVIEKVQRPDSVGSIFKSIWTQRVDLSKITTTKVTFKSLPFESSFGCCDYSSMKWKDYALYFNVKIGKSLFKCQTTDVRKGSPTVTCKE